MSKMMPDILLEAADSEWTAEFALEIFILAKVNQTLEPLKTKAVCVLQE